MFNSEWIQLSNFIQTKCPELLDGILEILQPQHEKDKNADIRESVDVNHITCIVQTWLKKIINAFETENANTLEQVRIMSKLS